MPNAITQSDILDIIQGIYDEGGFNVVILSLGGPAIVAAAIWSVMQAHPNLSLQQVEEVVETGLLHNSYLLESQKEFIYEVFDQLETATQEVVAGAGAANPFRAVGAAVGGTASGIGAAVSGASRGVGFLAQGKPQRAVGSAVGGAAKGARRTARGGVKAAKRLIGR